MYRWARSMQRYITKERDVCGWSTNSSRPQRKIAKTKCTLHFIPLEKERQMNVETMLQVQSQ